MQNINGCEPRRMEFGISSISLQEPTARCEQQISRSLRPKNSWQQKRLAGLRQGMGLLELAASAKMPGKAKAGAGFFDIKTPEKGLVV